MLGVVHIVLLISWELCTWYSLSLVLLGFLVVFSSPAALTGQVDWRSSHRPQVQLHHLKRGISSWKQLSWPELQL